MARILVVDDEKPVREMVQRMLEYHGHQVTALSNGVDALDVCKKNDIDLVITDVIMPKKDGLEIIIDLRFNFEDIKIIAISGGGRSLPRDYLDVAKDFGAVRTISKPFDQQELISAVNDALAE